MKTTLTFVFDDDENDAFKVLVQARDFYHAVGAYDEWLRSQIKYHDKAKLQPVRDKLYELFGEYRVSLEL